MSLEPPPSRVLPRFHLREIYVPWQRAVSVYVGLVPQDIVAKMQRHAYDQSPVLTRDHRPIGLITRCRLEELMRGEMDLAEDDPAIIRDEIGSDLSLDELLDFFVSHEAGIVSARRDADGHSHVSWDGFVTRSDLNRHPVRAALYPLFAELEIELAKLVTTFYDDPWSWLSVLDKDKQARLVGYWEIGKRENVDVGPAAGLMLSELLRIVGGTSELRSRLGFNSGTKWQDHVGGLADLRNAVMHPVRPIFTSSGDVGNTRDQLDLVLELLRRLDARSSYDGPAGGCC